MACHLKGDKSPSWKGDKVGYLGLHAWVRREKGRPEKCEHCGALGNKKLRYWNIHWANIDHKYRRDLEDYIALCSPCHRRYDSKLRKNNVDTQTKN